MEMIRMLDTIYLNPKHPSGFASVSKLYKAAKKLNPTIKIREVKAYLAGNDAYTLHKQVRNRFPRNRIIVTTIDEQWEIDLVDMTILNEFNNNYKFMLTCIDIFSKFAWVEKLKSKSSDQVTQAFEKILQYGRTPWKLRSDKGKEFVNSKFQGFLKRHDIHFFTSQNDDVKCPVIERFNRTIKTRMWRYFTAHGTFKWIDIINDIVYAYNNTEHRSIKEKPTNVSSLNENLIRGRLYPQSENSKIAPTKKLNLGDFVRISRHKGTFEKGYVPQWSEEIFKIFKIIPPNNTRYFALYSLKDLQNEPIEGTFYETEVQRVSEDTNREYKIETVLKRRVRGKQRQILVKWWGYPEKFNEWINESDVQTR